MSLESEGCWHVAEPGPVTQLEPSGRMKILIHDLFQKRLKRDNLPTTCCLRYLLVGFEYLIPTLYLTGGWIQIPLHA